MVFIDSSSLFIKSTHFRSWYFLLQELYHCSYRSLTLLYWYQLTRIENSTHPTPRLRIHRHRRLGTPSIELMELSRTSLDWARRVRVSSSRLEEPRPPKYVPPSSLSGRRAHVNSSISITLYWTSSTLERVVGQSKRPWAILSVRPLPFPYGSHSLTIAGSPSRESLCRPSRGRRREWS